MEKGFFERLFAGFIKFSKTYLFWTLIASIILYFIAFYFLKDNEQYRGNPEIKIEMGSHTDSVGSNSYNYQLSKGRAESTVRYLVEHNISADRIVARAYGEEQPIARNTNPDGTDNPKGRDMNRRTEFKILEVRQRVKPIEDEEPEYDEDKYFKKDGG